LLLRVRINYKRVVSFRWSCEGMDALLAYSSSDSSVDENSDNDELTPPAKKARQDLGKACKCVNTDGTIPHRF